MAHNRIVMGEQAFLDGAIKSGNCYLGNSIVGDELSIDTLTVTVISAQSLVSLPYGVVVQYFHDDRLIGKFYLHHVSRIGRELYEVSCVSGIGLLDTPLHYGGLYTGQLLRGGLEDVIGGTFPYTITTRAGTARVYGWLPVATRRENLRQLLFATGVSVKKDAAGDIVFDLLEVLAPQTISDDRLSRSGTVEYRAAVSGVVVLEHGYLKAASNETTTLYDDAVTEQTIRSPQGVTRIGALITFESPVYDLSVSGGSILESGVNYAVLAPSGKATLTGKKYTHTTREVRATPANGSGAQNIAKVEGVTLINLTNSESVADRVADYYSGSHTVSVDMVMGPERPGEPVTFHDPYDERVTGLLKSQDINISNLLLAHSEMLTDYVPEHGGMYNNVVVLSGSGTWTPPTGTKKIHVVVIGSGSGGAGGNDGEAGERTRVVKDASEVSAGGTYSDGPGKGGAGGDGGVGGEGGKVYRTTVQLAGGEKFSYRCAAGGLGGDVATTGKSGGDTTFGSISSSQGARFADGYMDILTGKVYAASGKSGVNGGKGGDGGENKQRGNTGESVGGYAGGDGGAAVTITSGKNIVGNISGNGGGGAAIGSIGETGEASYDGRSAGAGGNANALAETVVTLFGAGGHGGHGGGGGGGGGFIRLVASDYNAETSGLWYRLFGGEAGTGAPGYPGGDGCVLVYY